MMTQEQNDELTRIGPGTPMGACSGTTGIRSPSSASSTSSWSGRRACSARTSRVHCRTGRTGSPTSRCPHRGASLVYGIVEEGGLRCGYHGWKFDAAGKCIDILAEPGLVAGVPRAGLREGRQGAGARRAGVGVHRHDPPAPRLPRDEAYVMSGGRDVGHSMLPCNWLQIMENAVDPYHVEALHGDYFAFIAEWKGFEMPSSFKNKHVKVGFDAFEHGIIKRRQLVGQSREDDDWAIGHPMVFPYQMWVGGNGVYQMQIRVPVDDTHTWMLFYTVHAPEGAELQSRCTGRLRVPVEGRRREPHRRLHRGPGHHGVGHAGADRRSHHREHHEERCRRRRPATHVPRVHRSRAPGRDPVAVVLPARRDHAPLERSKFGRGAEFATQWIDRSSMRYSPQADDLKKLHIQAWANKEASIGDDAGQ